MQPQNHAKYFQPLYVLRCRSARKATPGAAGKNALLSAKMDKFRHNEENGDNIITSLRKDLSEKKVRKNCKDMRNDIKDSQQENAAVIAAALASINSQNKGAGNSSSE